MLKKRKLIISLLFIAMSMAGKSQPPDSTALILIDIQDFYFPGGSVPLVNPETAAQKAAELLDFFRERKMLVVHVGHLAGSGTGFHEKVRPLPDEKIVMKKEVNTFLNTGLDDFLRGKHIKNLVLCGMQTHMCLEGAVRAAHDLGYLCTVAADACATRDLIFGEATVKAADVHTSTLATLKSYAKVVSTQEVVGK